MTDIKPELNTQDCENLLKLLHRSSYNGLEEAEVGVVLKHKLQALGRKLLAPKPEVSEEALDEFLEE